jgi:hypothetical protein
MPPTTEKTIIN